MTFRLSQKDSAVLGVATANLNELREAVEAAVQKFNIETQLRFEPVVAAITEYNITANELRETVENIVEGWRDEWDEKSERWQQSDRGLAVSDWIGEWDAFAGELEEQEIDEPENLALPDFPDLEDMPAEGVEA